MEDKHTSLQGKLKQVASSIAGYQSSPDNARKLSADMRELLALLEHYQQSAQRESLTGMHR